MPVTADVPMRDVDLVIEAAVERLDLKKKIFAGLEAQVARRHRAGHEHQRAFHRPDRRRFATARAASWASIFSTPCIGCSSSKSCAASRTDAAALNTALGYVKGIGKLPVIVKDSPGFLVNRVLLPYMSEAMRLFFEEGYEAERIDRLMLDFGMPMGPLRLMDEVGLDVGNHVARDLTVRLPGSMPPDRGHGRGDQRR